MSTIVVDTDVVSFAFKNHPIALEYLPDPIDRSPIISFMTVAELDRWALQAGWGRPGEHDCRSTLNALSSSHTIVSCARSGRK
jgi:hypothetical protein